MSNLTKNDASACVKPATRSLVQDVRELKPYLVYSLRDIYGLGKPVVRLRRSNDNTELDWTAAMLHDPQAVAVWLAGNASAYVTKWYQQNPESAVQSYVLNQGIAGNQPELLFESNYQPYIKTSQAGYSTRKLTGNVPSEVSGDITMFATAHVQYAGSSRVPIWAFHKIGTGFSSDIRSIERHTSDINYYEDGSTGDAATVKIDDVEEVYHTYVAASEGNTSGRDYRATYLNGNQVNTDTTALGNLFINIQVLGHYLTYSFQPTGNFKYTELLMFNRILTDNEIKSVSSLSAEMRY